MKKILIITLAMLFCLTAYGANYALGFIGANTDYIDCGNDTELQMGTHDLTVEFWFKTSTAGPQWIIGNGGTAADDNGYSIWINNTNKIRAGWGDGTTSDAKNNSASVTDGNWHHVAVVYDRDDKVWVCIDGSWEGKVMSGLSGDCDNETNFVIGRKSPSASEYFTGSLDEVRIWNAVIDTATVGSWRKQELTSSHPNISNLMAYYKLNENTGTTANDLTYDYLSGNTESDGTITGADWESSAISGFTQASDSSLPVELASFTARPEAGSVVLEWITESETENLGFILDRRLESVDGTALWVEIANYSDDLDLRGQGSVTNRTMYQFIDKTVDEGKTYDYRLADVSYAGVKQYHSLSVVGVEVLEIPYLFTLHPAYPNPFNPTTTIEFSLEESGNVILSVYDLSGKKVTEITNAVYSPGNHKVVYDGSGLASGTYFYQIQAGSEETGIHKMMLIK